MANFSIHVTDTYGDGVFGLNGEYGSSHVIEESENQLSFVVPKATAPGMVDVELLYGGTQATPFVHQFLYYVSEGQEIVAMSPTYGSDRGGTVITVLGSGFTSLGSFSAPTCVFSVDSEADAEVPADGGHSVVHVPARISSQDIITCTTPAIGEFHSLINPGPASFQISLNGKDSLPGMLEFTYVSALTVLSVWPNMGSLNGGTCVIVRGTMFSSDIAVQRGGALGSSFSSPSTLWCRFGDQLVMADEIIDSTTAVCTTPPSVGASQVVSVSVGYNIIDFSEELQQGFTYHEEVYVTGLFPAIGQVEGGTAVRISGNGFVASFNGKPSAVTCQFGNEVVVEATIVEFSLINEQHVVCIAPPWVSRQPEKVVVGVSLNGVDFVLASQLFEYFEMPVVMEAVPCIGPETGGTEVVLHGTGFVSSVPFTCVFLDETDTSLLFQQPITTPAQYL